MLHDCSGCGAGDEFGESSSYSESTCLRGPFVSSVEALQNCGSCSPDTDESASGGLRGTCTPAPPLWTGAGAALERHSAMFRQQMLLEGEETFAVGAGTMCEPGVRMVVVSWMVEVAEEFRLQQETLHMSVLLLDRFLASSEDVPNCVLQLLAVGCMLLAAKGLEVVHPTVQQLSAVTANHFQPQDILRMERIILNVLEFRLAGPTCYTFLHLLAQVASTWLTPAVLSLAMYLCELAMFDSFTLGFNYSSKAAAALLLAQLCLGRPEYTAHIRAAVQACCGLDCLQDLGAPIAVLLRLQHIAYQHTVAAMAAAAAAQRVSAEVDPSLSSTATAMDDDGCQAPAATGPQPEPPEDLLAPLRVKFGASCWCGVSHMRPATLLPGQLL